MQYQARKASDTGPVPFPRQRGVQVVQAAPQFRGLRVGREFGGALRFQRLCAGGGLRTQSLRPRPLSLQLALHQAPLALRRLPFLPLKVQLSANS
jgi:hypothetical protein